MLKSGSCLKAFIAIWVCMFLATFAVSVSNPSVPYLIKELVSVPDDPVKTEELTSTSIGIILSINSVALVIGSLFGGFISDRVGHKKLILFAFSVLAFGFIIFILSQSLMLLFVASFLEMLGYYLASPSFIALVAGFTSHSSRGKSYGVFNLSWIIAQIPGPILGGFLAEILNLKIPFYFSLLMTIMTIPFSLIMPKRGINEKRFKENVKCSENGESPLLMPLRITLFLFGLSFTINGLANGFISTIMNSYIIFNLQASTAEFGLVTSLAFGVVQAIAQIPGGKLADKFGRKPLVLSSGLSIPLVPVLALTTSIWHFIAVLGLISFIGNISSPAIITWLMESVPSSRRGSASSITRTANGIGMMIGPVLGSYSWSSVGSVMSFAIAGFIFGVQLLPYLKVKETYAENVCYGF